MNGPARDETQIIGRNDKWTVNGNLYKLPEADHEYVVSDDPGFVNTFLHPIWDILHNSFPDIGTKDLEYILENSIIAGGCFKNILHSKEFRPEFSVRSAFNYVKDIDLYFDSEEKRSAVLKIFMKLTEDGTTVLEYDNEHSSCFGRTDRICATVDVVKMIGTPKQIIRDFDYTVTKFALYHRNGEYVITHHRNAVDDVFRAVIRYEKGYHISREVRALERFLRYINYGYYPTPSACETVIDWANDTDVPSRKILELMARSRKVPEWTEDTSFITDVLNNLDGRSTWRGNYSKSCQERRLLSREIHQFAAGYDETIRQCREELEFYSALDPDTSIKNIHPSLVILEFVRNLREVEKLDDESVIFVLRKLASPTRFVSRRKRVRMSYECCGAEADGVYERCHRCQGNNSNLRRDDEADIVMEFIHRFGIEEVGEILENIFIARNIPGVPDEDQWISLMNEKAFGPGVDFGLLMAVMKDDVSFTPPNKKNDPAPF